MHVAVKSGPARLSTGSKESRADPVGRSGRMFITSLARGLDVLRAFRAGDSPLSNRELAKRTGLPKPTISRITYTLTEMGYLSYIEHYGCYELGGSAHVLSQVARGSLEVLTRAMPAMEHLARGSGCNVGLGGRDLLHMVYLLACQGPGLVGLRLDVGARVPVISSAMGRAFIAACPDAERDRLIGQLKGSRGISAKQVDWVVEQARRDLATNGFCASLGEWHADINGIAAPVMCPALSGLYILNCGGPAYLLPHHKLVHEVGPLLLRSAQAIRAAVGVAAPPKVRAPGDGLAAVKSSRAPAMRRRAARPLDPP